MKTNLLTLLLFGAIGAASALAHQNIEIGPNGGRIFPLESKTTPRLEVAAHEGRFVVRVLDAANKAIPLGNRTLAITAGARSRPEKLAVEKTGDTFTATIPKGDEFPVVFQLREVGRAKALIARMNYDAKPCPECKNAEWLCACGSPQRKK